VVKLYTIVHSRAATIIATTTTATAQELLTVQGGCVPAAHLPDARSIDQSILRAIDTHLARAPTEGEVVPHTLPPPLHATSDFTLRSNTFGHRTALALPQMSRLGGVDGGGDISPHLQWSHAPAKTRSFAVIVYDEDAATGSGFWHWAVADLPPTTTEPVEGAGDGGPLPGKGLTIPNDCRLRRFIGAAPPPGGGRHNYTFTVHALEVAHVNLQPDATPALLGFAIGNITLARATIIAYAERS
jgi:Raf kinase inhibitor-like YbhB/YbcL family protein